MAKGTRFGKQATETAWQAPRSMRSIDWPPPACAYPRRRNFCDGVLLMDLVTDENGDAAPRLNDVAFTPDEARTHHAALLVEVVRMLCAGVCTATCRNSTS